MADRKGGSRLRSSSSGSLSRPKVPAAAKLAPPAHCHGRRRRVAAEASGPTADPDPRARAISEIRRDRVVYARGRLLYDFADPTFAPAVSAAGAKSGCAAGRGRPDRRPALHRAARSCCIAVSIARHRSGSGKAGVLGGSATSRLFGPDTRSDLSPAIAASPKNRHACVTFADAEPCRVVWLIKYPYRLAPCASLPRMQSTSQGGPKPRKLRGYFLRTEA